MRPAAVGATELFAWVRSAPGSFGELSSATFVPVLTGESADEISDETVSRCKCKKDGEELATRSSGTTFPIKGPKALRSTPESLFATMRPPTQSLESSAASQTEFVSCAAGGTGWLDVCNVAGLLSNTCSRGEGSCVAREREPSDCCGKAGSAEARWVFPVAYVIINAS